MPRRSQRWIAHRRRSAAARRIESKTPQGGMRSRRDRAKAAACAACDNASDGHGAHCGIKRLPRQRSGMRVRRRRRCRTSCRSRRACAGRATMPRHRSAATIDRHAHAQTAQDERGADRPRRPSTSRRLHHDPLMATHNASIIASSSALTRDKATDSCPFSSTRTPRSSARASPATRAPSIPNRPSPTAPRWSAAPRRAKAARRIWACRCSTRCARRSRRPAPTPRAIYVPPPFAADAILEAIDAEMPLDRLHHRRHSGARHGQGQARAVAARSRG